METPPPEERDGRLSRRVLTAHVRRTPSSFGVTLTVLAILFVLFYAFVLRPAPSVTAPALAGASGRFVLVEERRDEGRTVRTTTDGTFVLSGDGSADVEATIVSDDPALDVTGEGRWVYDAGSQTALEQASGGRRAAVTSGQWPPLWQVAAPTPLDYQGDAAIVRSAVEDDDETVGIKPVLYQEREAWRASWRTGRWQKDLVVDQETGLVLWYSRTGVGDGDAAGDSIEYAVEGLRLNAPMADGAFETSPPPGAQLDTQVSEDPRTASDREEAEARLGVSAPKSTLDPDGYLLAGVATTATTNAPASWIDPSPASGQEPASRENDTLLLAYAKGLSSYTIEIVATRQASLPGAARWQGLLGHELVELRYGLFAGRRAHTWYGDGPTAVVWGDDYAVRVSGGLTRTEAISVLEGLGL